MAKAKPATKSSLPIKTALFAAIVIGGGIWLYFNFGGLLTQTAERIASNALGVKVDIGSIHVSLQDRKATVNSLEIANPEGFSSNNIIEADSIAIGLNTASKEFIDFKDITVKGSVVNVEINEKGMNLLALKGKANQKEQRESAGSETVRVIIRHIVIDASTIHTSVTLLDRAIPTITLPALSFSSIGGGKGISAGDAIVQVMTRYLGAIESAVRSQGLLKGAPNVNDVKKTLDDAAGSLNQLFK